MIIYKKKYFLCFLLLDEQKTTFTGNKADLNLDDLDVTSALGDFGSGGKGVPGNTAGTQGASMNALSLNHKDSGG